MRWKWGWGFGWGVHWESHGESDLNFREPAVAGVELVHGRLANGQRDNGEQIMQGKVILRSFAFTLSDLRSHCEHEWYVLGFSRPSGYCVDKTKENGKEKMLMPVRNILQYSKPEVTVAWTKVVAFGLMKTCWVLIFFPENNTYRISWQSISGIWIKRSRIDQYYSLRFKQMENGVVIIWKEKYCRSRFWGKIRGINVEHVKFKIPNTYTHRDLGGRIHEFIS